MAWCHRLTQLWTSRRHCRTRDLVITPYHRASFFSQYRNQTAQWFHKQTDITWLFKTWITLFQTVESFRADSRIQGLILWIVDWTFWTQLPLQTSSPIKRTIQIPWHNKIRQRMHSVCRTKTSIFKMRLKDLIRHISLATLFIRTTWNQVDNLKWFNLLTENSCCRIQMHRYTIQTIAVASQLTPSLVQALLTFQCKFQIQAFRARPRQLTSLVTTRCRTRAFKQHSCRSSHSLTCQESQ